MEMPRFRWRYDWDRLASYLLFVAYGIWSLFFPIVSVERSVEHWLEILLGLEFVYAGLSMMYGLWKNHFMVWAMGMSVAFIGLATITMLVAASGGLRVLAYAFLFGAFATQSLYSIRRERSRRSETEIRRRLEDILASVKPEGTGQ